jgi:signal transduction histidine kinase
VSLPDAWTAVRGRPWRFLGSAWPWRSLLYVGTTVPAGVVALTVLFVVLGVGVVTLVVVVGVLVLMQVPLVARLIATAERGRLRLVQPRPAGRRTPLREQLRAGRSLPVAWSEVGYAVLLSTVLLVVDAFALAVLAVPVVLIAAPLLWRVDDAGMQVVGWTVDSAGEAWLAVPAGLVLLVVAVYLLTWLACGQAALARMLLDPPEQRLQEAVAMLRRSRSGLVDAFEAERHRIERDLHDGVQQRLVALTMTLGSAELEIHEGPGLELVRTAHQQAEDALADLRATVRGIHPRVLTDRGLTAAIHEIADRAPVPVTVDLVLPERLPGPVENAAYFVVSEALTNIARHAQATRAEVQAWVGETDGVRELVLTVTDDGAGGADPGLGSGLAGLAARIEALDGTMLVTSPVGGPTRVRVACPIR